MLIKIHSQQKKLDDLYNLVENIKDEEVQALMAKFLCVRTSGFLESSLKNLINEYLHGTSPKPIESFVNNKVKRETNLKYDRLVSILESFDKEWANKLSNEITDNQKEALNTIVSNRNNIAHGENDNISYVLIRDYYQRIKEVVVILIKVVKK